MLREMEVQSYVLWYCTPLALRFTGALHARCRRLRLQDELSAFEGAPQEIRKRERQLLDRSDVVFTGGRSLYEAKRQLHPNVHAFPSSVDVAHFAPARSLRGQPEPADQRGLPHPRVGYMGVIDERLDRDLLDSWPAAGPAGRSCWRVPSRSIRRACHAVRTSTISARRATTSSRLPRGVGRGAAPLRAQRGDTLHEPDPDARVPGRRLPVVSTPSATSCGRTARRARAHRRHAREFVREIAAALVARPDGHRPPRSRRCSDGCPGTAPGRRWTRCCRRRCSSEPPRPEPKPHGPQEPSPLAPPSWPRQRARPGHARPAAGFARRRAQRRPARPASRGRRQSALVIACGQSRPS